MDLNTYHIIKNYPILNQRRLLDRIGKSNIATSDPDLQALSQIFNTLASYEDFYTYLCDKGISIEFDPPHQKPDIHVAAGMHYEIILIEISWPLSLYGRPTALPKEIGYFHNTDLTQMQNFLLAHIS